MCTRTMVCVCVGERAFGLFSMGGGVTEVDTVKYSQRTDFHSGGCGGPVRRVWFYGLYSLCVLSTPDNPVHTAITLTFLSLSSSSLMESFCSSTIRSFVAMNRKSLSFDVI